MNLLPCELAREGSRMRLIVGDRESWIGLSGSVPELGDGERRGFLMGIRPEHLRVGPAGGPSDREDGSPTFPARVRRAEFQGDSVLLTLELAGRTVVARLAADVEFDEGRSVVVSPDLAAAAWFPDVPGSLRGTDPIIHGSTTGPPSFV
jgi:ABC-type sugar transport system ATPase subunit